MPAAPISACLLFCFHHYPAPLSLSKNSIYKNYGNWTFSFPIQNLQYNM